MDDFKKITLRQPDGKVKFSLKISPRFTAKLADPNFFKTICEALAGAQCPLNSEVTVFPGLEDGEEQVCLAFGGSDIGANGSLNEAPARPAQRNTQRQALADVSNRPQPPLQFSANIHKEADTNEPHVVDHNENGLWSPPKKKPNSANGSLNIAPDRLAQPNAQRQALADVFNRRQPSLEFSSAFQEEAAADDLHVADHYENDLFLFMYNVSDGSTPKEITDFLTLFMHMNGYAIRTGCPVVSCSLSGRTAKIKMRSLEERQACLSINTSFKDNVVTFGTVLRQDTPAPVPEQNVSSKPIPLESDDAVVALLHELIKQRHEVSGARIKANVMTSILSALRGKNINFTAETLLARKKYLLKYYREKRKSNETSWRFYDLVGQLVGDIEFTGEFAGIKLASDRVLFDHDSTIKLIHEYGKRKGLFDRAHRPRQLWEEVAAEVHKSHPSLGVTWESCERKWQTLKGTYFNFKDQVERSGADTVVLEWPFYDTMSMILNNSVMAEPRYTFAVGAKKEEKKKKKKDAQSVPTNKERRQEGANERPKEPRRLSSAARKMDLEERKINMQEKFLQLMTQKLLQTGGVQGLAECSSDSE